MPDDLENFVDIVKSRDGDDAIIDTAKETFNSEIKAVERFAKNLGVDIENGLKNTFKKSKDASVPDSQKNPAILTPHQKGANLFNDVGCDFRGTYVKLDKPLGNKGASIYTNVGPRKQNLGVEYKKGDSTFRFGAEHKHSVGAAVLNYDYKVGTGNLSIEAKASSDVSGVSATYRDRGLKVNASLWEGEGVMVNFEKNFKLGKSDAVIGGAVTNDYGFVYGRIVL